MTEAPTTRHEEARLPRARAAARDAVSNGVRLGALEWLVTAAVCGAALLLAPGLVDRLETLPPGPDRRVPFARDLSKDYQLFSRLARRAAGEGKTLVLGDSVVWGHYVSQDETLPAALNRLAGGERFANLGMEGMHPAAMAGLVEHYGGAIRDRRVLLHCNLWWMNSPRHDLRLRKEMPFNHPALVPQFLPWIACYRATVAQRLAAAVRRELPYEAAAQHLRLAYFDRMDIPTWTVSHPYASPLAAMARPLPSGRPAASPAADAVPWTRKDMPRIDPAWVKLASSLQWQQFRRTVDLLVRRGNRLFVVLGPFNEHMLEPGSLETYRRRAGEVEAYLRQRGMAYYVPTALPSEMYADHDHPLADGYAMLAAKLYDSAAFARFEGRTPAAGTGGRP